MKKLFFVVFFNFLIYSMDNNCPICIESLDNNDTSITLPCNHSFHEDCIETQLSLPDRREEVQEVNVAENSEDPDIEMITLTFNNNNRECPLCRFYFGNLQVFSNYKAFVNAEKEVDIFKASNAARELSINHFNEISISNCISHAIMLLNNQTLNTNERNDIIARISKDINSFKVNIAKRLIKLIENVFDRHFQLLLNDNIVLRKFQYIKNIYSVFNHTVFIKQYEFKAFINSLFEKTIEFINDQNFLKNEMDFFEDDLEISILIVQQQIRLVQAHLDYLINYMNS